MPDEKPQNAIFLMFRENGGMQQLFSHMTMEEVRERVRAAENFEDPGASGWVTLDCITPMKEPLAAEFRVNELRMYAVGVATQQRIVNPVANGGLVQ